MLASCNEFPENQPPKISLDEIKRISPMESTPVGKIMVLTSYDLKWWADKPKEVEWEIPGVGPAKAKMLKATRDYRVEAGGKEKKVSAEKFVQAMQSAPADAKYTWFQPSDFVHK